VFILYDENMNLIPFPVGVKPLDIFISSIQKERETETLEGMDGKIDYGATYSDREPIELKMLLKAHDTRDYRLLRNVVYAMIDKIAYVSEEYERGKRYRVTVDESFIPERIPNNQRFATADVNCSMPGLPFAESIGTTQDIQRDGINTNSELWGFGMGLISDDDSQKYTHKAEQRKTFAVYNAGNVLIHPFEQKLRIEISDVYRSSSFFELNNETNGSTFKVTEKVDSTDKIVLDGANIQINNLEALRRTNRKYIQLDPGWNIFSIEGALSADIKFDFPFYYK